jgi:serine/threonine protein kinase
VDDYAGRVLADRYRLPLPPSDDYELDESRAFDTYSGQEVLVRQVPLPEVVEAEVLDADGLPDGYVARDGGARRGASARSTRRPAEPAVRRAIEAAQAAAQIPDHPRLDQVFDVFAEGGSLWIVSELVSARPLAALLAEKPLTPYRAAEVAADVLTALRALHAHGWVHRNITARTVLICEDGRVVLTGLAAGAAEEALCGYDPVPVRDYEGEDGGPGGVQDAQREPRGPGGTGAPGTAGAPGATGGPGGAGVPGGTGVAGLGGAREIELRGSQRGAPGVGRGMGGAVDAEAARRAAIEARAGNAGQATDPSAGRPALAAGGDARAARAGAIAAYRAGARAAARVHEEQRGGQDTGLPAQRPAPGAAATGEMTPASGQSTGYTPPGQIADPYGVGRPNAWHGALPRPGTPGQAAPGDETRSNGAVTAPHQQPVGPSQWDQPVASTAAVRRGPATALAAERARQARMAVVGPVTERWAPEQAGPVHENWQLAAPIGPATDLWALGALLFRAVQGHAPYPEENTAELVQLVCAEPPAFAEECGPLRPVVESLLRQDPTDRLDFEELRGWLRSLVRSAPEPDAGAHVIAAPPADTTRLTIVRRRGELVRRRRRPKTPAASAHARHRRDRQERPARARSAGRPGPSRQPAQARPRKLGRNLLLLILLAMAAAIAYAIMFMPKAGTSGAGTGAEADRTGTAGDVSPAPQASSEPRPDQTSPDADKSPSESSGATKPQSNDPEVARGFTLRKDGEGFRVAVADGWDRAPKNGRGQVVYSQGSFELIVVPGRDSAKSYGSDPLAYQREDERELQPFRDSSWATSSGMRLVEVGGRSMAEGQFTWQDTQGREIFVRNLAILVDGRYHVVQVRGPEAERDEVTRLFEQASTTYQVTK